MGFLEGNKLYQKWMYLKATKDTKTCMFSLNAMGIERLFLMKAALHIDASSC
jgi:hypothetical protein